ncbi:MAG: nuclear transport factor 2 family protein [Saprospiraceae bacterium]|nr:nuclear transport factor 2 family protein [Saprospiraceae bacterium]
MRDVVSIICKSAAVTLLFFSSSYIPEKQEMKYSTTFNNLKITSEEQQLFNLIKEKDSLLFQIGFNQIDTLQMVNLISTDFEFYHDVNGITDNKSAFIENINGIRELPFKTWRILVEGSMEVFPLYTDNNQILYGAIQHGVHDFFQQPHGEEARKTSTAKFTHLWIIENGNWKLKRVLSYNHQVPK